jgi:hypothetical protein
MVVRQIVMRSVLAGCGLLVLRDLAQIQIRGVSLITDLLIVALLAGAVHWAACWMERLWLVLLGWTKRRNVTHPRAAAGCSLAFLCVLLLVVLSLISTLPHGAAAVRILIAGLMTGGTISLVGRLVRWAFRTGKQSGIAGECTVCRQEGR